MSRQREAVIVAIPDMSLEQMGIWERHASTLLQVSLQMRGLKARSRIEWRVKHGKDSLIEASCEAEPIVALAAVPEVSNG